MQEYQKKTDDELVTLAQGGDRAAAECLMHRHKETVRRAARKFTFSHPHAEADDLVQEGMIGLYSAIDNYSPACGKKFKNFVFFCATRKIQSYLRILYRQVPEGEAELGEFDIASEEKSPEELLLDGESDAELRRFLARTLSDFEFRVVTMYLDGMSYAQISEATGKELKSVDNALARAKHKLSEHLR